MAAEGEAKSVNVRVIMQGGGCCKGGHFPEELPTELEGMMTPDAFRRVMADISKHSNTFWGPGVFALTVLTAGLGLVAYIAIHTRKANKLLDEHPDIPHALLKMRYVDGGDGANYVSITSQPAAKS
mmetsp:Transcript_10759/g.24559  ORF Transcript_10759/g.24559 Transcript_10759/m.24559 type:complete len:126 (+) Transcript_10759:148-525(+)